MRGGPSPQRGRARGPSPPPAVATNGRAAKRAPSPAAAAADDGSERAISAALQAVRQVLTHGAGGAQLFLPGGGSIDARTSAFGPDAHAAAFTLDTTGAGDVILAAYAYARGGGAGPAAALSHSLGTGMKGKRRPLLNPPVE